MDREASRMIIYSCITNGYDEIPDEHYYDPDIKYVMFTDNTVKKKGPWEFREIPCDHPCHRRRSAYVKINPHKVFPYGTKTVWLDGCYVMTPKFVENCKKYLEHRFTVMRHCNNFNYYEEILESFLPSMCTFDEAVEITKTIKDVGYNFKDYCSPVLASIWRVLDQDMYNFGDLWWKYSLIGTNRDQISFDTARQLTKTDLQIIENAWIRKEPYIDENNQRMNTHYPGDVGILFGSRGKKYRKKLHPQNGHKEQWRQKKELLNTLRPITGLHPIIARYNFDEFVDRNVLSPQLPIQN